MTTPLLRLAGISKRFPGVVALDRVDLELVAGQVLGLVGENGAGKSTLIKVLGGVHPASSFDGSIELGGRACAFGSAADGLRAGIAIVHQELSLIPAMTVADNLLLGREPGRHGLVDRVELLAQASEILQRVLGRGQAFEREADPRRPSGAADSSGATIDPELTVGALGIGQQQLVEIARAMAVKAQIVVLDEPTAALTERETERLFELIRAGKAAGTAFVYVSHRLDEIFTICDRIAVLRDGKLVATRTVGEVDTDEIVNLMTGGGVADATAPRAPAQDTVLQVEHLSMDHRELPGRKVLDDVSLRVRAGEIVALAGAMGSGRTALLSVLFGDARARVRGRISVGGHAVALHSPRDAIRHGVALVPEDRKATGLVIDASVADNMTLSSLAHPLVDAANEEWRAGKQAAALKIKMAGLDAPVASLSGGNQQKVVLGRCLMTQPRLLLLDEPTRGVDVGARAEIYNIIRDLVADGRAVLMASSDLAEILTLADRVVVLREGKVAGELDRASVSEQAIMQLAVGTVVAA